MSDKNLASGLDNIPQTSTDNGVSGEWYMDDKGRMCPRVKGPKTPWQGISVDCLRHILQHADEYVTAAQQAYTACCDPAVVEESRKIRDKRKADKKAGKPAAKPATANTGGGPLAGINTSGMG